MRIVFVGASELTVMTARRLIERSHDVVVIDSDKSKLDDLADQLDCSLLHGDGTKPAILREVDPARTDVLFCLTHHDHANMIASLVGRSLGFGRVITRIEDPEFESICRELGLDHTIVPSRTISRYLADFVGGLDIIELSTVVKGEARFLLFNVTRKDAVRVGEIKLPSNARIVWFYRDGEFGLADESTKLHVGDEAVILTHSSNLAELERRWQPKTATQEGAAGQWT